MGIQDTTWIAAFFDSLRGERGQRRHRICEPVVYPPSICLRLYDMIDDQHFYRGLPHLRFESELFPYSNEDSGFFRGVSMLFGCVAIVIVNSR